MMAVESMTGRYKERGASEGDRRSNNGRVEVVNGKSS